MNLWLDDVRNPAEYGFAGYTWVKTRDEAIEALKTGTVERVSLDHDLGMCDECLSADSTEKVEAVRAALIRNTPTTASYCACPHNGTGYEVVCWMEEHGIWPTQKPLVHSANPVGRRRMQLVIDKCWKPTAEFSPEKE